MKKSIFLLALVLILFAASACAPHSQGQYEFDPGETLSPETLESIFVEDSVVDTTPVVDTTLVVDTTPEETKMTVGDETVVYFTDSGTKYHLFADCQSLSRSTNVKNSTLGNKEEHKKKECCKYCAKRANILDTSAETT